MVWSYLLIRKTLPKPATCHPQQASAVTPQGPWPENFDLSEEARRLELGCRWQALGCREHAELLRNLLKTVRCWSTLLRRNRSLPARSTSETSPSRGPAWNHQRWESGGISACYTLGRV